jgi:hypothetical protein
MQRKSLAEFIDSQDNMILSHYGTEVHICVWEEGTPKTVAIVRVSNLFDADGNYFERDI